MNSSNKPKIRASQIVADIKAGMSRSALKSKYRLSEQGLEHIFKKLIDADLLSDRELPVGRPTLPASRETPEKPMSYIAWRCPLCGAPQAERPEECPQCGAIASKAEGRFAAGIREQRYVEPRQDQREISNAGTRLAVAAGVVILLLLGTVLLKLAMYRSSKISVTEETSVGAPSGSVLRFTTSNFEQEVIERSREYPVLVQFHSDY